MVPGKFVCGYRVLAFISLTDRDRIDKRKESPYAIHVRVDHSVLACDFVEERVGDDALPIVASHNAIHSVNFSGFYLARDLAGRVTVAPIATHPHKGTKVEIDENLGASSRIPLVNLLDHFKFEIFDSVRI